MSNIVYRDRNITEEEKNLAKRAVNLYAQFFNECDGAVHPDWRHDWPTMEEIQNNYLVHERSFARGEMDVDVAIDVQGGPVRVNYKFKSGGTTRRGKMRIVQTPIEMYTRSASYDSTSNTDRQGYRDSEWESALNKLDSQPPALLINRQSSELLIDTAYPRHLELRNQRARPTTRDRLFPVDNSRSARFEPFSMIRVYKDSTSREDVVVKLTQLKVEVPIESPYFPPATSADDRKDGAPSSMLKTHVLLETTNPRTKQHEFSALLRIRIGEEEQSGVRVGKKWEPSMASNEGMPQEHRKETLIKLGRRPRIPPTGSFHSDHPTYLIKHFSPDLPLSGYRSLGIRHQGIYQQLSPAGGRRF
ncbi:hypothetical protein JCM3765_007586 [Sporobolomyces pararoseus]